MTRTTRYLTRMVVFLAVVIIVCLALVLRLQEAFLANAILNGLIVGVLLVGIIIVFRQVLQLNPEIHWIKAYRKSEDGEGLPPPGRLLAPMATMLGERRQGTKLSALSTRSVLDGLAARLDEGREISRYLIGLLIFLGLLGTFWGLLGTLGSIGETIRSLSVGSADLNLMFDDLKRGLQAPISSMATAFSSSLFGLAGSVVLGFLDLQAGQAQNRFYADLEDWLASETKLARAAGGVSEEEGGSLPAYVTALLEQSADSLDSLQRAMSKSEMAREEVGSSLMSVAERLEALTDQMQQEQSLMAQLGEGQGKIEALLERLTKVGESPREHGLDEASRQHLRNIDVHLKRLIDDQIRGRGQLVDEIRSELKLLARTVAAMMDGTARPAPPLPDRPGGGPDQ